MMKGKSFLASAKQINNVMYRTTQQELQHQMGFKPPLKASSLQVLWRQLLFWAREKVRNKKAVCLSQETMLLLAFMFLRLSPPKFFHPNRKCVGQSYRCHILRRFGRILQNV